MLSFRPNLLARGIEIEGFIAIKEAKKTVASVPKGGRLCSTVSQRNDDLACLVNESPMVIAVSVTAHECNAIFEIVCYIELRGDGQHPRLVDVSTFAVLILPVGYRTLTRPEVLAILRESM